MKLTECDIIIVIIFAGRLTSSHIQHEVLHQLIPLRGATLQERSLRMYLESVREKILLPITESLGEECLRYQTTLESDIYESDECTFNINESGVDVGASGDGISADAAGPRPGELVWGWG